MYVHRDLQAVVLTSIDCYIYPFIKLLSDILFGQQMLFTVLLDVCTLAELEPCVYNVY